MYRIQYKGIKGTIKGINKVETSAGLQVTVDDDLAKTAGDLMALTCAILVLLMGQQELVSKLL